MAAVKGNLEVARALIEAGAKKSVRSKLGELPVHCVRRVKKNTRLFDSLTTSRRQLESWPEAWRQSELRGRAGKNRESATGRRSRASSESEDSVFNSDDDDRQSTRSTDSTGSDVFEDEDA